MKHGASSHDGGAKRSIPSSPSEVNAPQHAVDVALAQAALAKSKRVMAAIATNPERSPAAKRAAGAVYQAYKFACRFLSVNPWRTLSSRMRDGMRRFLGAEAEQIEKRALATESSIPEVLKVLPKKPPKRAVVEEHPDPHADIEMYPEGDPGDDHG